jgi:hypothetical protein
MTLAKYYSNVLARVKIYSNFEKVAASNSVMIGKYLGKVMAELCSVYGLEASK